MIQSMTGYGKATVELPDKKINVEIKSLNSKAMDLSAMNFYRIYSIIKRSDEYPTLMIIN